MVNTQPVDFRAKLRELDARMRAKLAEPRHAELCARIEADLRADAAVQVRHRRKQAGIPAQWHGLMDDPWGSLIAAGRTEPRDHSALDFVRSWLNGDRFVAILAGDLGRGKSVAMCWAIDQRGGAYVEASDICRAGFYGDDYWETWLRVPLLALDELGMEPCDEKGWWESKLYRLLSGRLSAGRRTLLAANMSREALKARYGSGAMERLWDRLEANWEGRVFTGPSLRRAS